MRSSFSLFQSHIDMAHYYWHRIVVPGDIVIDATCGKGKDMYVLCQLAITENRGKVYGFDIQKEAIETTTNYLQAKNLIIDAKQIRVEQRCHSTFPEEIKKESIRLIVYNLGYLPGSDKQITTKVSSTILSLQQAQLLIQPGGVICITCYPGHLEGLRELEKILDVVQMWPGQYWSCCHHQWINRYQSPTLLLLQRSLS